MSLIDLQPRHEKTCLRGSDQARHKPACKTTESGLRHEISDLGNRGIVLSNVAKTKTLISLAVTGKLICAFVFAYAKSRISYDAAHLYIGCLI